MEVLDMEVVKSKSLMLPLGFNFKPAAGHGQKMVEVAIKIYNHRIVYPQSYCY